MLGVRQNFLWRREVKRWNGPAREVVELPSLDAFKTGVDKALPGMSYLGLALL